MKIEKQWTLPPPDKTDEGFVWHPVVRIGRHIPFGYKQDPEDKDILLPIEEELELYEKAKVFYNRGIFAEMDPGPGSGGGARSGKNKTYTNPTPKPKPGSGKKGKK